MDVSAKREEIAECIVVLKKGLKHLRRDEVDVAIQLLLDYDRDLKRMGKVLKPTPIQKQGLGNDKIVYEENYQETATQRSVDAIKAVVINEDGKSTAYPLRDTAENTAILASRKMVRPIAPVIIDPWMKEHFVNEVPFTKIYATIVIGHIETRLENIISVGCQVEYIGGQNGEHLAYEVTKMDSKRVWIKRGFLSFLPVKKNKLNPIKQTEVKYFKIDNWPQ